MSWMRRSLNSRRQADIERDLSDEVTYHREQHAADLEAEGWAPEEARREDRRLGWRTLLASVTRLILTVVLLAVWPAWHVATRSAHPRTASRVGSGNIGVRGVAAGLLLAAGARRGRACLENRGTAHAWGAALRMTRPSPSGPPVAGNATSRARTRVTAAGAGPDHDTRRSRA